ncbi:uncharacterized protein EV420DRAFT_1485506 [Desarmillaria tabescens]|uniref:Uncharacterized protein n=1 Tax=Armillaria tabescens TaxID=1929756 RepID=A0AA39JJS9_ARMTA|nr:uncharacterized protein EV420DRAFT_1485506 [Desarmillaria tabescens]KAK0441763.1 hypothetical protein EV420DRAFT_1485506 [Desarmillaria tabescens]
MCQQHGHCSIPIHLFSNHSPRLSSLAALATAIHHQRALRNCRIAFEGSLSCYASQSFPMTTTTVPTPFECGLKMRSLSEEGMTLQLNLLFWPSLSPIATAMTSIQSAPETSTTLFELEAKKSSSSAGYSGAGGGSTSGGSLLLVRWMPLIGSFTCYRHTIDHTLLSSLTTQIPVSMDGDVVEGSLLQMGGYMVCQLNYLVEGHILSDTPWQRGALRTI